MQSPDLAPTKDKQDSKEQLKGAPYFIVIQKKENKTIIIPCSNEQIAKKVLASHSNYNSNCKGSLM